MLASFIVPNWGVVTIVMREDEQLLLDSGLWQVSYISFGANKLHRHLNNLSYTILVYVKVISDSTSTLNLDLLPHNRR